MYYLRNYVLTLFFFRIGQTFYVQKTRNSKNTTKNKEFEKQPKKKAAKKICKTKELDI